MFASRSSFNRSREPKSLARRIGTFMMVGLLAAGTFASLDAEAKRMGGGRSVGRQSQTLQQRQATPPAQQPMQQPAYAGGQPSLNRDHGGYNQDAGAWRQAAPNDAFAGSGSTYAGEAQRVFGGAATAAAPAAAPMVPAGFDTEAFLRNAKVYFVRLQAAWDEGNLADIREFTTPEMFAEVKIDLDGRGAGENQTDVVRLDAELLAVEDRGGEHFASVRFHGMIRETQGAAAEPFDEVWNLSKSGSQGWLLAGIQQVSTH